MERTSRSFTTDESTILFPHLIEPAKSPFNPDRPARFECSFALSNENLTKLRDLIKTMIKEAWGNVNASTVNLCVKERKKKNDKGEYEPLLDEAGKQTYMLSAWSYKKPICVDVARRELKEEDVYTGMLGRGIVNLYTFESVGRKHILAGLGGVVKTGEGTRPQGASNVSLEIDNILSTTKSDTASQIAGEISADEIPF